MSLPAFFVEAILSFLPSGGSVPTDWVTSLHTIWFYMNTFAFILPMTTILTVFGIAMTFHLAIFAFRFFHWVITKIPFIG